MRRSKEARTAISRWVPHSYAIMKAKARKEPLTIVGSLMYALLLHAPLLLVRTRSTTSRPRVGDRYLQQYYKYKA